jgi:hypothetical protein
MLRYRVNAGEIDAYPPQPQGVTSIGGACRPLSYPNPKDHRSLSRPTVPIAETRPAYSRCPKG